MMPKRFGALYQTPLNQDYEKIEADQRLLEDEESEELDSCQHPGEHVEEDTLGGEDEEDHQPRPASVDEDCDGSRPDKVTRQLEETVYCDD